METTFADRIRSLRCKSGESLEAAARGMDLSTQTLWRYEKGERKNPSMSVLRRIADHYGVAVRELMGREAA